MGGARSAAFPHRAGHLPLEATLAASAVAEPTSLALFGTALIGLGLICRRRSTIARGA